MTDTTPPPAAPTPPRPPATLQQRGHIATHEASRIMQRLCYHFKRKIEVQYDEHQGQAHFPWGDCAMRAEDGLLHLHCTASDAQHLARVRHVIDEHVALFSRKQPLQAVWQPEQPLD